MRSRVLAFCVSDRTTVANDAQMCTNSHAAAVPYSSGGVLNPILFVPKKFGDKKYICGLSEL